MLQIVFVRFFDLFVTVFNLLIIVRIIISWVAPHAAESSFGRVIHELTEPVLSAVRKLLPQSGMIDWAPLVSVLGLQLAQIIIHRLLLGI